jgi:hypothetical protein
MPELRLRDSAPTLPAGGDAMNFHPTNDNRRDPFDVMCDMVAGVMSEPLPASPPPLTDLRRHHHEMIARLAAAQPPRIGRSDSLDADGLEDMAEHMQEVGNAFSAYAMQVVAEFANHSAINRAEVQGYMRDAFGDAIGALFNAVEDVREWGRP